MFKKRAVTLLETVTVILIIGIIAVSTIPKFINLKLEANNAKFESCRGGMRSAVAMYQARTSIPEYEYLCKANTDPPPNNPFRIATVPAPCYPASCEELNSLIISMDCDVDCSCYDANTGQVVPCA